jgi:hypothetical protein
MLVFHEGASVTISLTNLFLLVAEDMTTIRTTFAQLLNQDSMKHIDYKTFNSIQVNGVHCFFREYRRAIAESEVLLNNMWSKEISLNFICLHFIVI